MRHLGQAELDAGDVRSDRRDAHAERLRRVEHARAVHVHGQALRACAPRRSAAHPGRVLQAMSCITCAAGTPILCAMRLCAQLPSARTPACQSWAC
jgi:hypothetical protein